MTAAAEAGVSFACFGARCAVAGDGGCGSAQDAVDRARGRLLSWHARFSRFEPASELCRLNADPRHEVPVGPTMARLAAAVVAAAEASGGLVDATRLDALEAAGYRGDLSQARLPLRDALALAPPRRPAGPARDARWREIAVDGGRGTITRPPGVRIDGGGLAKGLFADLLADELATHASVGIDCAGDLRLAGMDGAPRGVRVASPFDDGVLHAFELAAGGVATSGIGRRSWLDARGRPAHHLLDPATGRPAFTGLVQATALAPTALEAELRAKAALLSGADRAAAWLPHGGVLVRDDGEHAVISPPSSQEAPRVRDDHVAR